MKEQEKLGDLLVKAGLIDEMQLRSALGHQRRWGGKLGKCLVDLGFLSEEAMLKFLSEKFHMKAVDLTRSHIAEQTFGMVPENVARKYEVVPVVIRETAGKKTIMLAMSDPSNLQAVDEIQFLTNARVEPVLATDSAIMMVLEHYGHYSPDMLHPKYGERHPEPKPAAPPTRPTSPSPRSVTPPPRPAAPTQRPGPAAPPPPPEELEPESIITLDEGIDIEPDEEIEVIQGEVTMLKTKEEPPVQKPAPPKASPPQVQQQVPRPEPSPAPPELPPEFIELKDKTATDEDKVAEPAAPVQARPEVRFPTERVPGPPPVERSEQGFFVSPEVEFSEQPRSAEPAVTPEPSAWTPEPEIDIKEIKPDEEQMEIERGPSSLSEFHPGSPEMEQKQGIDYIEMGEDDSDQGIQLVDAHEFIPGFTTEKASEAGVSEDSRGIVHPKLLEAQDVARVESRIEDEPEQAPQPQEAPQEDIQVPELSPPAHVEQPQPPPETPQEMELEPPDIEVPPLVSAEESPGKIPEELPIQEEVAWDTSAEPAPEQRLPEMAPPPPQGDELPSIFDEEPPSIDFLKPQGEREIVLPPPEGYEFVPKVSLPFEGPVATPEFEGDLAERPDTPDFDALPEKPIPDTGLSEKEMFFNVEQKEAEPADEGVQSGDMEKIPAGAEESSELVSVADRLREIEELDEDFLDTKTVRAQMEKILELETEVRKREYQFDDLLNLMMKKELGEVTSELFMKELTSLKLKIEDQRRKKRKEDLGS